MDFRLQDFSDFPSLRWKWIVAHDDAAKFPHLTQMCGVFFAPGTWEAMPHCWRFEREQDARQFFDMTQMTVEA